MIKQMGVYRRFNQPYMNESVKGLASIKKELLRVSARLQSI